MNKFSSDMPRERLTRYGPAKLKDGELLAILLGTGTKGTNALELSKKILLKWKDKGLGEAGVKELAQVHGLGTAKACKIAACFELGRRLLKDKPRTVLMTPEDVWQSMIDVRASKREHLVVFYLDSRNAEIQRHVVSIGTLNEASAHPREVFEEAVKHSAAGIILAHNHPSGDLEPSRADIELTRKLWNAGKLLDIELVDHVIVTKDGYRSILQDIHG